MGVIEQQKNEIEMQFVSIAESISIIADCENTDINSVLLWFKDQDELIHKQLMLKKESVLSLIEFNPVDDSTGEYYESPAYFLIKYLKLAFVYDDLVKLLSVKKIGFARKRFLFSLLNLGIDVKENYLHNAISYIPHSNNEYDAHSVNTYKYLTEHISELVQENTELNKKINHNQLLEKKQDNCSCEVLKNENAQLKQRIAELEQQLKQSQELLASPQYKTPAIECMEEVIKQFWSTYDPEDDNMKPPTQTEILAWLERQGHKYGVTSENMRKAIDSIARHPKAKSGGKTKLG